MKRLISCILCLILLADVPGQAYVRHLSVVEDGTVNYVFSSQTDLHIRSPRSDGVQYYTITPGGVATKQPDGWRSWNAI